MGAEEPTTQEVVAALFRHAAELMQAGHKEDEIRESLVAAGVSAETASKVLKKLFELRALASRRIARRTIFLGALWCLAGIGLAVASFLVDRGGMYAAVAALAVGFGGFQVYRGLTVSKS